MSTLSVLNPATEAPVTEIELFDLDATDRAIARAAQVATEWRDVSPAKRAHLLRSFAQVVDEHVEELAQLEVANSGHTIGNARWEAGNVRNVLAYYSGAPERHSGKQIPVEGGVDLTFYEPLGVVGIIVPWNSPTFIVMMAAAPALAAGNTVVIKPSEITPASALELARLAVEAGIPPGGRQCRDRAS